MCVNKEEKNLHNKRDFCGENENLVTGGFRNSHSLAIIHQSVLGDLNYRNFGFLNKIISLDPK